MVFIFNRNPNKDTLKVVSIKEKNVGKKNVHLFFEWKRESVGVDKLINLLICAHIHS